MEEVKTRDSNIYDIVIHPPISCEQEVSNEEDDNGVLDQDYRPDEVAGEVEIHDISTESKYTQVHDGEKRKIYLWILMKHHHLPIIFNNMLARIALNFFRFLNSRNH